MRAAVRTGLLGWTISFTKDYPKPRSEIHPSEVLLRVKSAAINPVDYKLPRFIVGAIVGFDVSGIVEKVGSDVSSFQIGDEVFGRPFSKEGIGSMADVTIANMDEIAKKPPHLSFTEAAALPTAYLTGFQALRDIGNVKQGSTVLVIGASGGCGMAGVQLALAMGASRVVGICSGRNFDFVERNCGITELVDYTDAHVLRQFVEENKGKFDCIYDTATGSGAGEDYVSLSISELLASETGQYIQINGGLSDWMKTLSGKTLSSNRSLFITKKNSKPDLEEIASLLKVSGARPYVNSKEFNEEGVKEGFLQLKERRTKGKIVYNME